MTTPTEMLNKYIAAEQAILEGKEVSLGDRKLRMEDLPAIREGRQEWERRVAQEQNATARRPTIGGISYSLANFNGGN